MTDTKVNISSLLSAVKDDNKPKINIASKIKKGNYHLYIDRGILDIHIYTYAGK